MRGAGEEDGGRVWGEEGGVLRAGGGEGDGEGGVWCGARGEVGDEGRGRGGEYEAEFEGEGDEGGGGGGEGDEEVDVEGEEGHEGLGGEILFESWGERFYVLVAACRSRREVRTFGGGGEENDMVELRLVVLEKSWLDILWPAEGELISSFYTTISRK